MSIIMRHLGTFVIKNTGRMPRRFLTRCAGMPPRQRAAGCAVVGGPRTTGDGCYESRVAGPEGALVEITV